MKSKIIIEAVCDGMKTAAKGAIYGMLSGEVDRLYMNINDISIDGDICEASILRNSNAAVYFESYKDILYDMVKYSKKYPYCEFLYATALSDGAAANAFIVQNGIIVKEACRHKNWTGFTEELNSIIDCKSIDAIRDMLGW